MAENVKIITEDVIEILDTKIKTSSAHTQLDVILGEFYNSVLTKIAARSPTLAEKQGLDAALSPSASNHFVTFDEMNVALVGKIPWKTVGQPGTDSDFEGTDETPFLAALASGANWIIVKEGTWVFTTSVSIPSGMRLTGTGAGLSIIQGSATVFIPQSDTILSHMTVQTTAGVDPVVAIETSASNVDLSNLIVESFSNSLPSLYALTVDAIRIFDCAFITGSIVLDTCTNSMISSVLCNCPTVNSILLDTCTDISVIGCIMSSGVFTVTTGDKIRALGNHFNDGISSSPWGTDIIFRANTPKANNNEEDDFSNLIQYIGAPDVYTPFPPYSSNYAGPSGQDLTTRASALDLLTQWRYEERNLMLFGSTPASGESTFFNYQGTVGILTQSQVYEDGSSQPCTATADDFIAGSSPVSSVDLWLCKQIDYFPGQGNTPTSGVVRVAIYNGPGLMPTTEVAHTDISVTSLPSGDGPNDTVRFTFTFSSPVYLTAGNRYFIVVKLVGSQGGHANIMVKRDAHGLTNGTGYWFYDNMMFGGWVSEADGGLFYTIRVASVPPPWTVSWNPTAGTITTTAQMKLMSIHRAGSWVLPTLLAQPITDGWALYYVIDRSLGASDVILTPQFAALGSIPNNSSNRQVWVLAFRLGSTLWWRGGSDGGGVRFPGTGGQTGTYYIDGTSKSFLDYVGATDVNDPDPNYSNNFSGIQGESLTTRLGKSDTLIKRLFEYSNLGWYFDYPALPGYIGGDASILTLSVRLYFVFPHANGRVFVEPQSWSISDGQILYFTWDQSSLGVDQQISPAAGNVVSSGSLPLPDDNQTLKYFVFAQREGNSVWLWDGTEVPLSGGRWPVTDGVGMVRTAAPSTLSENIIWDGSKLYWENIAVWTSTGLPLTRNAFANNTSGQTLSAGQGIVVTFTWNSGAAASASYSVVSLPLSSPLKQNQFLWVQNLGGVISFGG